MKRKCLIGLLALVVSIAMALPAMAVDLEYGGYWRTRAYTIDGFSGDSEDTTNDVSKVDARGRLWTKHVINEELAWTNRVEFNVVWGDELSGGGIGTDGTDYLRFKHSFVDYETEQLNTRIGLQRYRAARGMLFSDDFAGMIFSHERGNANYSLVWMKVFEGGTLAGEYEEDLEDLDVDFAGLTGDFSLMDDALMVKAYGFYLTSEDAREWSATTGNEEIDVFYVGADLTYTMDNGNIWAVLLYETGDAGVVNSDVEYDVSGYMAGLGGEINFDALGIHGEVFYASGDDDLTDTDSEAFYVPQGQSYYWSEIMGGGVFDDLFSNGSPGTAPTNIIAYNIGTSYEVNEDLVLRADLWYAEHAETNQEVTESKLGTEIDLRADYMLNEDLKLTAVGAYLFADDATNLGAEDPTDVYEIGVRLSLSFNSEN